jgi:lipopolysaccharide/colanic/teichoic acid biosynthesis glycosyltransferase
MALSMTLLVLLMPLCVLICLLIRVGDGRPVLFRQVRVGRFGQPFHILKFRTMFRGSDLGSSVTVAGDKRLTRVGRFLRKWKLDELPQLLNVLRGEMSMVGPRPDVPGFADRLSGVEKSLLELRPGVTGPASLRYRDEDGILALQADPERYNREIVFPDKVRLNLGYARKMTFLGDIYYLLQTVLPVRKLAG